ncbi:MAG: gfo/Idh/MocA family oxidoreductase [Desulfobacteraceae bacterium]|nr:MAG: gfo/Idh/MocA family oxidoreductase [Desulfobacteraceae bacterium]
MKLKIALVGCGQIADGHAGEIKKIANAELVGVCDIEPIMAEQLAMRFNIPAYFSNFSEMLNRCRPDVVHICTPPASHLPLVKEAVTAGCHVYVEKPLAMDYDQCLALVDLVLSSNRKITIGHNSEFDPPSLDMRKLVEKGVLGDPVHIESWFGYSLAGPFGKAILSSPDHWVHRLPGKLFQNNINHLLNKITEFVKDERPYVHATAWKSYFLPKYGDIRDDLFDELRITIKGKDVSAYGTFTSNVKPVAQFTKLYGTKGIIEVDYNSRVVTVEPGAGLPSAIGRLVSGFSRSKAYAKSSFQNLWRFMKNEYHYFAGLNYLITRFYESILQDKPLPISTTDMLRISWIMDEIFRQINNNKE